MPISRDGAVDLIEYFSFEVESFYPFVSLEALTSLAEQLPECPGDPINLASSVPNPEWSHQLDDRNIDMLKVFLGCAMASKTKGPSEVSRQLTHSASEELSVKFHEQDFDFRDIARTVLLVSPTMLYLSISPNSNIQQGIYHLQCDETVLAWRKISTAAKMCQELDLHKSLDEKPGWIRRMFWCTYVLDKRLSLMASLPFAFHDADIIPKFPEEVRPHHPCMLLKPHIH